MTDWLTEIQVQTTCTCPVVTGGPALVPECPIHAGPFGREVVRLRAEIERLSQELARLRQCRAEYQRPSGRYPGDRIVRCHLPAGHSGEHEEADTEVTWTDGAA